MAWLCKTKIWRTRKTVYIKRQYLEIAEDFETRSDTLNYELDKSLPREKYKKVIGFMKDELAGKIMTKLVVLRAKTDSLKIIKTVWKQLSLIIK